MLLNFSIGNAKKSHLFFTNKTVNPLLNFYENNFVAPINVNPFSVPQNTPVPIFMLFLPMKQFQQNLGVNCQTNGFSDSESIQQPFSDFQMLLSSIEVRLKTLCTKSLLFLDHVLDFSHPDVVLKV